MKELEFDGQGYFASRLPHDPRRERTWSYLTRYLSRFVPPDAAVLELGAGYCYFINNLSAARRVAVDVGADLPRFAGQGVEARQQDALAFLDSAEPGSFDFVFASNFLEHFEWPALDRLAAGITRCCARADSWAWCSRTSGSRPDAISTTTRIGPSSRTFPCPTGSVRAASNS